MDEEFVGYDRAPGFWFYVGMVIASDISKNPKLRAKYTKTDWDFDVFEVFEDGIADYLLLQRHKEAFKW